MLPYSRGLILDNGSNYGIVKTEAIFGFGQRDSDLLNVTEPMEWLITPLSLENRSRQEPTETSRAYKPTIDPIEIEIEDRRPKKPKKKRRKVFKESKDDRKGKKVNKCVLKIMKKNQKKRKERKGNRVSNMKRKYMLPLILGLLAAKSVLIPIALKALAFMSAKGFLMGFFSTILASFLSIKGMFDHNHRSYSDRKDEKTQVEIIQVPSMPTKEDHYYDEHYKRADFIPVMT